MLFFRKNVGLRCWPLMSDALLNIEDAPVQDNKPQPVDSSGRETEKNFMDGKNRKCPQSLPTLPEKIGRKRGRPKQKEVGPPLEKLMDKIINATKSSIGSPAVYASTTKGGMKLIYDGHHFRYSFRRGEHSVFQCCYKENKEECKVRVVSNQKRVFPLDGEHVHFIQATDKSVTSCHFETADSSEVIAAMKIQFEVPQAVATAKEEQPPPVIIDNELLVEAEPDYFGEEVDATQSDTVDANDFREKIKKRLQKALLGKKK